MALSPINQRRWRNFKANRRALWSLIIFLIVFTITLFAEFVANDKPILVKYRGEFYTPVFNFYPETTFGGDFRTEAIYRDIEVKCLIRTGGLACAAGLLALRIGMLGIVALQLLLCFRALGADAVLADAALHAIAPVVGSAVGIVPGGLGVSEAIGAALALLASASPAMAFAALALNRIAGYACALATVLGFQLRGAFAR